MPSADWGVCRFSRKLLLGDELLGRGWIFICFGCDRLMMQVNVTEAGISGKGTSVRRGEF